MINDEDYGTKAVLEFYLSGIVSLLKYKVECGETIIKKEIGEIVKFILQNGVLPQLKC